MDSSKKHVKPNPEEKANPLSVLFYWWFLPFFKFGYSNEIKLADLYNATKSDLSGPLGDQLQKCWEEELQKSSDTKKKKPSLKRAIFKAYYKPYSFSGIVLFIQFTVLRMLQPFVLAEYINYYNKIAPKKPAEIGWALAVGVVLMAFINVIITHSTNLGTQRIGMRVRIAICSLIYRKLLKLSHSSLGQTAAGQLVNLLSNDVQRFDIAAQFVHYLWITPFNIVIGFYVMYRSVGTWGAIAGMGLASMQSIPLQGYFSKLQGDLRYKIALKTDYRIKIMSEITSGIQVIKMYAWEKPFEKVVELARKLEINLISKTSYIYGVMSASGIFTERVTLYLTIIAFVFSGNRLSADVAFSLAQLFNTIQLILSIYFPRAMSTYAEGVVSIQRIESFLLMEENEGVANAINATTANSSGSGEVKLTQVNASWTKTSIVPTLMSVDLHVKPGTLCCVVGQVGAGKSSLLQLLLGELPVTKGKLEVNGKVSYACQEPWLFVSSVKDNILFGKEYDKRRYKKVVDVCCLEQDFKQFPFGDRTLVGERGTSLSGGQRARVNLARAVYADADIYLLDDPLSAVDTKVGRRLFDQCIANYLKDKTRILVTHQLQFMKEADVIVIIKNGKIEKVSSFDQLSENEINTLQQERTDEDKDKAKKEATPVLPPVAKKPPIEHFQSISSLSSSIMGNEDPEETDELITKGGISNSTYWEYWKSGCGVPFLLLTIFMFVISQMITNASDLWLKSWTNAEELRYSLWMNITNNDTTLFPSTTVSPLTSTTVSSITSSPVDNDTVTTLANAALSELEKEYYAVEPKEYFIWIYSALIILSIVLLTVRSFMYYKVCMTASKVLHNKMFNNVLQAPMRFFDTNPSGRILNRFSKDMGAVDELLPRCQLDALQIFMVMLGILVMVFIVTPWMIIPACVLSYLFYFFRKVYVTTAQSIKRWEGITRAPVFSHVVASLYGLSTIRSSQAQAMVAREFDELQDLHTSTWYLFLVSSNAFGFYLDCLSTTFLALVTFQFLLLNYESVSSGSVGLIISHSIILTGMVQYGVRQSAEIASNMVSVERVLDYTKLEKEGPFESLPAKKPPRDWPGKGKIIFKNTYLRYALDLPPVLKNLNIEVNSGEKIGIVGRTGAGKSTLIASLFRLAPIDGTISIDSIDTADIGLNDLRLNISIIPQEPILFSAPLRYNLDPFEKHSDEVLWKALENVELKDAITDLNHPVSEGGSNFSAGQRQLICLARAIVRNNKILVMDEATANVDPQTDGLIQRTIRERFKDCTVLTIAHRLNTIMDSDRVLVMDAGQAVEFDHPHLLLRNPDGYLSKMVRETGPSLAEALADVAREDYARKFGSQDKLEIKEAGEEKAE
ncbi:unnamed protein product [Phyllotreta striolata]|uniref:Uncharacterized protein n=1 Tax=Phyllotreta striolata TaxID=444603 RepID=A0A9N9XRP5_PHYSR|nr:unnamed protein product [Phyllotreta striolata]